MAMTQKQQALAGFDATPGRGRPQQREYRREGEIQPVARPSDSFVQVGPPQKSNLFDLADALSSFSASLGSLSRETAAREKAAAEEADKAAAMRARLENGTSYSDAVKKGLIPPQASPVFVKTYKEQDGTALGRKASAEIALEFEKWDGGDNTPAAFESWLTERVKERFGSADTDTLKAALPFIRETQAQLSERNVKRIGERLMTGIVDKAGVEIDTVLSSALKEAGDLGQMDTTGVARTLDGITGRLKAAGVQGKDLNRLVVDRVVQNAIERGDVSILDVLLRDRENGTPGPGNTTYGREEISKAEEKILSRSLRRAEIAETRLKRERQEGLRLATRHVVETLLKDPNSEISPEIMELGSAGDPDFVLKVDKIREGRLKRGEADDPEVLRDAMRRIWESKTPTQAVLDEVAAGNIKAPSTMWKLLEDSHQLERSRNNTSGSSITQLDLFKRYTTDLTKMEDSSILKDGPKAAHSVMDFEIAVLGWERRNPNATAIEKLEAIRELGEVFKQSIVEDPKKGPVYTPPDIAKQTQQKADQAIEGERALPKASPISLTEGPAGPGYPQGFRLPQDVRSTIQQEAAASGVDPKIGEVMAFVESSGIPTKTTGSYKGLFQLSDADFQKYGGGQGDILNPSDNARAFFAKVQDMTPRLKQRLGRDPDLVDIYLSHQQGEAGYATHVANPDQPAWKSMADASQRGAVWGAKAVWGNMTPDMKAKFPGGVETVTSRQFVDMWRERLSGQSTGGQLDQGGTAQTATQWMEGRIGELMKSTRADQPLIDGGETIKSVLGRMPNGTTPQDLASAFLGKNEAAHSETLSAFFEKAAGIKIDPRKTAWCAAFMNAVLQSANLPQSDQPLLARSFLKYGTDVTKAPSIGDIAVFERGPNPVFGHVGFYQGTIERNGKTFIKVLGGNQKNSVSVTEIEADRLLSIRRPPTPQ